MATKAQPTFAPLEPSRRIGVTRLALAGGVTATLVFVICWIGALVPFPNPTHAYTTLFTTAGVTTVEALIEGSLWSLLFGGFTAAVFALVYNLFEGVDRR